MAGFIKCSCGKVLDHGDTLPHRVIENGCESCKSKITKKPTPTAELYHARVERLEKKIEELKVDAEIGKFVKNIHRGISIEHSADDSWRLWWTTKDNRKIFWKGKDIISAIVCGCVAAEIPISEELSELLESGEINRDCPKPPEPVYVKLQEGK